MSAWRKVCCCLIAAVAAAVAQAEVKWSYDAGTKVLAQIDAPEGKTPWEFYLSSDGTLTKKVNGDGPILDLREETWPAGTPDIKTFPRLDGNGIRTCEEVYLPDTVTALNGNGQHTFYMWTSLKVVRLPAGLSQIPNSFLNVTSLRQVDIYGGAQKLESSFIGNASLTNIVFHQDCTVALPGGCFHSCKALREITWGGWFTYTKVYGQGSTVFYSWSDLQCRFIVPYDNLDWYRFIQEEVTPWDQCAAADKTAYFNKYGADAEVPTGISVSTYAAGGLPKTYIIRRGGVSDRVGIGTATTSPSCSSVTVSPAPDEDGRYAKGTVVTVSVQLDAGAEFRGWTGDVAEADRMKTAIEVTADDVKYVKANVISGVFTYDSAAGTITDGEQVVKVTKSGNEFTIGNIEVHRADGVLDLSKPVASGETITKIPDNWSGTTGVRPWLKGVILPETITYIGNAAFYQCQILERITPFVPHAVTTFGATAVEYCYALESDFEFGFATNAAGEAVPSTIGDGWGLYQTYKVYSAKFGPGVSSIPANFFPNSNLKNVDFGCNLTTLNREVPGGMLTNAVIRCTNTVTFAANVFKNQTKLKEITWYGWYAVNAGVNPFSGWGNLQCRFIVPGDNVTWRAFASDSDNVTPWEFCSSTDQAAYVSKFGAEAKTPVGITKEVSGGLPRTYIVYTDDEPTVCTIGVTMTYPGGATVTLDPQPDESGYYERGTEVTVTLVPNAGVTFRNWTGDVPEGQETSTTLTIVAEGFKSVKANLVSDHFHYNPDVGTLIDGQQEIAVTKGDAGLTVGAVMAYRDDGVLDLAKPVDSGDLIVAIPANWAKNAGVDKWATDIYLPDGLKSVGASAFYGDTVVRHIIPMFPASVTSVGSECLRGCSNLESPFEVGYGVDAEGNPLEVTLPTSGWLLYQDYNIPALRFGPGVTSLGNVSQCYACTSVRFAEFGPNLTTLAPMPHPTGDKKLTNVVFRQTATIALPGGMFHSQTSLREITWNGWFTYGLTPTLSGETVFCYWPDRQCRFLVPGDNEDWIAFILDPARVTPWNVLSPSVRKEYYTKYGADAAQPAGLSVAVAGGMPQMWIVVQPSGFAIDEIEVQAWGARPVPVLRDAAGNVLAPEDFDCTYLYTESAGTCVVVAKGKAGTAYADKSNFATFIQSARTAADTFTWAAAADGAFEDDANWTSASGNPGHPELPGDVAVLPTFANDASYAATVSGRLTIKSLTIGDTGAVGGAGTATLVFATVDARNSFSGDVRVKANGVITHAGPGDFQKDIVYLDVGGGMTVEAGGSVTATARGHNSGKGKGWNDSRNLCSPGYAGYGHGDSSDGGDAKAHADFRNTAYGSVLRPTDWGTGANAGATAGGAIRLVVAGTLTVDGTIEADGLETNSAKDYSGTGGSVWITCGRIAGSGSVTAMEGAKNASWGCGVRGSGGRVAIYETVATDFKAFPLSQISVVRTAGGAVGTIYLEHAAGEAYGGWLYIDAGVQARHRTPIPMADDGDPATAYANVNVVVKGGAVFSVEADTKVRNLDIQASDDGKLKPTVFLNGHTLTVRSTRHLNGRRWFEPYSRAVEDGWIDLGGTDDAPGKIVWLGDISGTFLFFR